MGTNYYHIEPPEVCHTCKHDHGSETTHIGKSSAGWQFHFHGTGEIRSYSAWLAKIRSVGRIVDEYGRVTALDDFEALVEGKRGGWTSPILEYEPSVWRDPQGYWFSSSEFS